MGIRTCTAALALSALGGAAVFVAPPATAATPQPNTPPVADGTRFHENGNATEYISWFGASLPLSAADARAYSAEGNKAVSTVATGYVNAHPASGFPAHKAIRVVGSLSQYVDDGEEILPLGAPTAGCLTNLGQSHIAVVPDQWAHQLTVGPDTTCTAPGARGPFSLVQTFSPPSSVLPFFAGSSLFGDFNGDGRTDVLAYGPNFTPDAIWYGTSNGFALGPPISVNGDYEPAIGDFNGDGRTDVLWYSYDSDFPSSLWLGRPGNAGFLHGPAIPTPPQSRESFDGKDEPDILEYAPLVGDFNGDGKADVYWYVAEITSGPLPPNLLWFGRTTGFTVGPKSTSPFRPSDPFSEPDVRQRLATIVIGVSFYAGENGPAHVGDFNHDGKDDLLWYQAGTARLWRGSGTGFTNVTIPNVYGEYTPVIGNFEGTGFADVLWYGFGSEPDSVWEGTSAGVRPGPPIAINGVYEPVTGDFNGDGKTDVFWYSLETTTSHTWFGQSSGFRNGTASATDETRIDDSGGGVIASPTVGDFNGDGHDDLLWSEDRIDFSVFSDIATVALWHAH